MKNSLAISAFISAVFIFSTAAQAESWQRNRTVVGPYGGIHTMQGSGTCTGNACSSNQKWIGPANNSVTRNGSHSCSGNQCSGSATWNGPSGGASIKRNWQRY